jgi:hypothetical protein
VDGKEYRGTYRVEGRPPMIEVTSDYGRKTTTLHGTPAELLAQMMLRELVEEARARGEI